MTRVILDAAVDGIITIDEEGLVETFSAAAERIFGYQAEEVLGKSVNILMPEPHRHAHDSYIHNYLTTGEAKIIGIGREVQGRRKDGGLFPMDLAVGEGRVEGRRIFAGIVRDITERKLTEQRLRQSEERFRLLVETVSDYAIVVLDPDGRVTSWNTGGERLTGWRGEEILGQPLSRFYTVEDKLAGEPDRALRMAHDRGRFEREGWRIRKDGSRFWAHMVISPLRDEGGGLRGYVAISRDMSERKRTDEALRNAKEEAERANLAKSKFLAAASHDLRQPVQALFFFTQALAHKLKGSAAIEVLGDLERSLEALSMLLDSLLDISKLDAGVVKPRMIGFAAASLLDRMEAEFRPQAEAKGLEIKVVSSSAFIRSDPALLGRVLQNLIANAVRYTEKGRILVGVRRRGRSAWIEVWDTGIGVAEDQVESIFEEFYQVANPQRDRSLGLGLGLAIVSRLIRLLGHRIEVRSRPGKGSLFRVEVALGEGRPMFRGVHPIPAPTGKPLILVIDDEAAVLKGLAMVLDDWGFEVLTADTEVEAMQKLARRRQAPNAILADYRLREGRTGAEAIRHIRDAYNLPIPSIIITGDTGPERLREAEASGFSILHKPVQPPQLQSLLDETLRRLH